MPLTDNDICALLKTGTKFFRFTKRIESVLCGTDVGKIDVIAAFPTIGASYTRSVLISLIPETSCRDLLVLTIAEKRPSKESDGAENTTVLLEISNEVTVAGTGTRDLVDVKDTETSDADNARRFEQKSVTRVPPIVETTEGETK